MPYSPLPDLELPPKLVALIRPGLQKYVDEPPGVGMGVVYVQISPSGKMYVGQHCHRGEGNSMSRNRANKTNSGCTVIANAFKKYGAENIRSFIIAHVPEGNKYEDFAGDTNALEKFYISRDGLDTRVPNGYNLHEGGRNGKAHEDSKKRMSSSHKKRWDSMTTQDRRQASLKSKKAKLASYADPVAGPKYKAKLSATTIAHNAKVMNDEDLRTARRERRVATRKSHQPLIDAKKWIPLMAAAKDEEECLEVLKQYKKTLRRREVQNNSVARRNGYGNPPPPMSNAEAARIGREKIAANIEKVVAKRKLTRGY